MVFIQGNNRNKRLTCVLEKTCFMMESHITSTGTRQHFNPERRCAMLGNNWARARGWRVDEVGLQIQVTYDLTRNWLIFLQSKLGTGGLPLCTCLEWWNVFRVRNFRGQTFGLTKWCELQQLSVSFLGKLKAPQPKPQLVGSLEPSKTGNWNELRSASWILLRFTEMTLNGFFGTHVREDRCHGTAHRFYAVWPPSHKPDWALRRPEVPPYFLDWVPECTTAHHFFFTTAMHRSGCSFCQKFASNQFFQII